MDISILNSINEQFALREIKPDQYSPLSLAFIGDCVFDLVVKTVIVTVANCPANALHRKTSRIVKAESQAKMADFFLESGVLTEVEQNMYRRGRNAKSYTSAKNASISDYRKATGVEALVGYLYLIGDTARLVELVKLGMEAINDEKSD